MDRLHDLRVFVSKQAQSHQVLRFADRQGLPETTSAKPKLEPLKPVKGKKSPKPSKPKPKAVNPES